MQRTGIDRVKKIFIKVVVFIIITAFLVLIDQFFKNYLKTIHERDEWNKTVIIEGLLNIVYTTNDGAAWSFLSGVSWAQTFFKILTCVAFVGFVALLFYSFKKKYKLMSFSFILIIAGTIGNFIDRLRFDYVVDFISFSFFNPVFNIADSYMTVGIVLLIIHYLFLDKNAIFSKNGNKEVSNK